MKIMHVPVRSTLKVDLTTIRNKLPKNLLLFTTAQFLDQIREMKKQTGAKTINPACSHTKDKGHILGCTRISKEELSGIDAILFVGDGKFHPQAAANDLVDVYCYNPKNKKLEKLDDTFFSRSKRKTKLALNTFYRSKDVGVLISTKPGQKRLRLLEKIKKFFPDKTFYPIMFDTLDIGSLEDFSFIQCFVNTACPRIAIDDSFHKPCLNIQDLEELNISW